MDVPHRIVGGVILRQRMNAFVSGGFEKGWKDGSAPKMEREGSCPTPTPTPTIEWGMGNGNGLPYYLNGQPVVPTGGASPRWILFK